MLFLTIPLKQLECLLRQNSLLDVCFQVEIYSECELTQIWNNLFKMTLTVNLQNESTLLGTIDYVINHVHARVL